MPETIIIPSDTVVYVVGNNTAGYLPESEPTIHLTINGARATLACDLDELSDLVYEMESIEDVLQEFELSSSISASAELVKGDRDGDITHALQSGHSWNTYEDTGNGIDSAYWVMPSTIGEQFPDGDDDSEAYGALLEEYYSL